MAVALRHAIANRLASYVREAALSQRAAAGPSEAPKPGFVTLDAGTTWQSSARVNVRGIVRKLFDHQMYSSSGPRWVLATGRNGSVTLAVGF
jgi:outer membrane receptor for ferrienterochelin and colicin